jgi:LysR family transcriptional regulator, low CO2-responsive transcriptional regulator
VSVTPTQLRAFAAVVRLGSVKRAATELEVSQPAVSLHIAQLRKELGDKLFIPTAAGLSFTPGGLRLASRAAEILGLQDQTVREVSQAGSGHRLLRIAASTMFAEHAAPGLLELFSQRAKDLDVELSDHPPGQFASLLMSRTVDVAIGPHPPGLDPSISSTHFLNYQVVAVTSPTHRLATIQPTARDLREVTWLLGPSAATGMGVISGLLRRLNVPEDRMQIFQSHAAALDQAKRGAGLALALSFAVSHDLANGHLHRIPGPMLQAQGGWSILTLAEPTTPPAAAELARFVTRPEAIQAMLRGTGVLPGRFKPFIHVTLWS